jgi:hypothetical protein
MDNTLILFSAIAGLFLIVYVAKYVSTPKAQAYSIGVDSGKELIKEINKIREFGGLKALTECKNLNDAASDLVLDQYQRQYWNHVDPEGAGPIERAKAAGYNATVAGGQIKVAELLAYDQPSPASTVAAWVQIPSNLNIISDPSAQHVGCGAVMGVMESWRQAGFDNWNRVPYWCALVCSGGSCSYPSVTPKQTGFLGTPSCTGNECLMVGKLQTNVPQAYVGTA